MESIQQFELILLSKMDASSPSKCSFTEEIPFGDHFANGTQMMINPIADSYQNICFSSDLFLKSVDEFTGIDFLAELDKDEKMYIDGEFSRALHNYKSNPKSWSLKNLISILQALSNHERSWT